MRELLELRQVRADEGERVVHFVGDAGGEKAQRFEPRRELQALLGAAALAAIFEQRRRADLRDAAAQRESAHLDDHVRAVARGVEQRRQRSAVRVERAREAARSAVRVHDATLEVCDQHADLDLFQHVGARDREIEREARLDHREADQQRAEADQQRGRVGAGRGSP